MTWSFWFKFVFRDALAYVALYIAIRGGIWDLRTASLKLMAPLFSAFDHFNYRKLIAQHIADIQCMPDSVIQLFRKGGFVVSITGRSWSSVAIDEAHEMCINKACKTSIVHPSKDLMNRISGYLPYRSKCMENLKKQLFPENQTPNDDLSLQSFYSNNTNDQKSARNVKANITLINSSGLLDLSKKNSGLINSFTNKKASPEQEQDL